ncbi:MAG: hypothetical protein JW808_10560 [Victivallales bacterium]|nr:hypothetical protein [Victivallales bacterium]
MKTKLLRKKAVSETGKITAIECTEESLHLLRVKLGVLMPVYLLGTLPFVLGLIYFLNDMRQSSDALRMLPPYAVLMALLMLWKNTFQALFCRKVMECLTHSARTRASFDEISEIALKQGIVQPAALVLLPVSALLVCLLPWTLSFFNSFTVVVASERGSIKDNIVSASRNTVRYPVETYLLCATILVVFTMAVLNAGMLIFLLPFMLKTFLGVNTPFANLGGTDLFFNLVFNSTFWSVVLGAAYLCVDPLCKTAYTVRLFYAESVFKGFDMLASLGRLRRASSTAAAGLIIVACMICLPASGDSGQAEVGPIADAAANAERLDSSIERVLSRREYSWRMPQSAAGESERGLIITYLDSLVDFIDDVLDKIYSWLENILPSMSQQRGASGLASFASWVSANSMMLSVIFLAILAALGFIAFKRRRRYAMAEGIEPQRIPEAPDLRDNNIVADLLKNSEWLELARKMIAEGQLRLAIRAIFLASIVSLSEQNALTIAKHKTNLDYLREVRRRRHGSLRTIEAFRDSLSVFESVWYGNCVPDEILVDSFMSNFKVIQGTDERQ